jgi:asparagine synthase (glutamine-hydrolysing)
MFAGFVSFDGRPVGLDIENRIVQAMLARSGGRIKPQRSQDALFVCTTDLVAGERPTPLVTEHRGTLFASLARLDNRAELGAMMAIPTPELAQTPDSTLLMRIFDGQGDAGIACCLGAFVFARWDSSRRQLILGRDYLGTNFSLFFHRGDGFVIFATGLALLLSLPCVPRTVDEISLANFMAINMRETRHSFYVGVERVPSRSIVKFDPAKIYHRHYWSPNVDTSLPYRRDEDYIERARELFDKAVATTTVAGGEVAISTSGGLDSSAVAATAVRLRRAERIVCYTLVPPPGARSSHLPSRYRDESDKLQALGRMYPSLTIRFLAPDAPHPLEQDNVRYFATTGAPAFDPANLGWFSNLHDAVARDGHRMLLDGYFGNLGVTWDGKFVLRTLLCHGNWRSFARELALLAAESGRGVMHAFVSEVLLSNAPAAMHRAVLRYRGRDPRSVAQYSALNPAFVAEADLWRQWKRDGFDPWFGKRGWHSAPHRAFQLFDSNQPARDFLTTLRGTCGFIVRSPHAERRLLEFALTVPESLYRRDGVPRSFARAVFADRLPPEILGERRRGAQGGAWFRRLDARRREIAKEVEELESSPMARRLIDLPRLKQLVNEWPPDEEAAFRRASDYQFVLSRGVHIGRFIRWVERGCT